MTAAELVHGRFLPSDEVRTWLQGLAGLETRFIELVFKVDRATGKTIKKPRRTLNHYEHMRGENGLASALAWIEKGSPIGIQPSGRLWILDADNAEQVAHIVDLLMDRGITPLMVTTKRGAHFYFFLPADFPMDGLKQALHRPMMDFIFGPVSLVVAPGTHARGRDYIPATAWFTPPVLDPREILPTGEFWNAVDDRPYLVSTERLAERTFAARGYLIHKAPVCIRGTGKGSKTLGKVAAHVCGWYLLSPSKATAMMRGPASWNSRFVDGSGKPAPFSRDEIFGACQAAEGKGSPYGRIRWIEEQARLVDASQLEAHIEILKAHRTMPDTHMEPVARIYRVIRVGEQSDTVLGEALEAHGIKRRMYGKTRTMHLSGIDYPAMRSAVLEAKRDERGVICPLIPRLASGGVPSLPHTLGGDPIEALVSHVSVQDSGERLVQSVESSETLTNTAFLPETFVSVGYQTAFDWAEPSNGLLVAPGSPVLPRLRLLLEHGLLGAMAHRPPVALSVEATALLFAGLKSPGAQMRQLRQEARRAGLVAADGTLTHAGNLALSLQGAA